jgi:hypothetical protein
MYFIGFSSSVRPNGGPVRYPDERPPPEIDIDTDQSRSPRPEASTFGDCRRSRRAPTVIDVNDRAPRARRGAGMDEPTVLGLSRGERLLVIAGLPALGTVLGYFLPRIAEWLTRLPWVPFERPLRMIARVHGGWAIVGCVAGGLVLGAVAAFVVLLETLNVTVTGSEVRLDKNDRSRTIARRDVGAVFVDDKKLVILDRESRQLVRDDLEGGAAAAELAFVGHGYPWVGRDPYADLYRRWIPDHPELPAAVNAVLKARDGALRRKAAVDVTDLGDEVQKLGFVVRDEGDRQYVRPLRSTA